MIMIYIWTRSIVYKSGIDECRDNFRMRIDLFRDGNITECAINLISAYIYSGDKSKKRK